MTLEGQGRNPRPVRAYENICTRKWTLSSVDLRSFQSILIYFSEKEIEELQVAIDKRRRLALDEESLANLAEQSDYTASGVEAEFSQVHMQHPA